MFSGACDGRGAGLGSQQVDERWQRDGRDRGVECEGMFTGVDDVERVQREVLQRDAHGFCGARPIRRWLMLWIYSSLPKQRGPLDLQECQPLHRAFLDS